MKWTATLVSSRMVPHLPDEMSSVHLQVGAFFVLLVEWNSKDAVLDFNCLVHVSDFEKISSILILPSLDFHNIRCALPSHHLHRYERINRDVEILLQYRTNPMKIALF